MSSWTLKSHTSFQVVHAGLPIMYRCEVIIGRVHRNCHDFLVFCKYLYVGPNLRRSKLLPTSLSSSLAAFLFWTKSFQSASAQTHSHALSQSSDVGTGISQPDLISFGTVSSSFLDLHTTFNYRLISCPSTFRCPASSPTDCAPTLDSLSDLEKTADTAAASDPPSLASCPQKCPTDKTTCLTSRVRPLLVRGRG